MSYPSIKEIAPDFLNLDTGEQRKALWEAFHRDLQLGLLRLKEIVVMKTQDIQWHDPNSQVGKKSSGFWAVTFRGQCVKNILAFVLPCTTAVGLLVLKVSRYFL